MDAGAPEGNRQGQAARPSIWTEGWNIKPDLIFQMPKPYTVPKTGTIQYTYFVVPSGLTKDTWVTDAEVRAGNRAVVHHASVYIRPPGFRLAEGRAHRRGLCSARARAAGHASARSEIAEPSSEDGQ